MVALNEEEGKIFLGECKLKCSRFKKADAFRLKEKASAVKWRLDNREQYYGLFSAETISNF